jgi:nicotinate dehydrogenase subunit B
MTIDRREFLAALGASSIVYVIGIPTRAKAAGDFKGASADRGDAHPAVIPDVDYADYLVLEGGTATAYSNRTEMGQGLRTVLVSIVSQGLELPRNKVRVILGDTATCPDDGPTTGSCATRHVGWAYWLVCSKVRTDLRERAASMLGAPASQLDYRKGEIVNAADPGDRISIFDLGRGERVILTVDPSKDVSEIPYKDPKIPNVLGKQIVTGALTYAGDVKLPGMLYGGLVQQPYHRKYT